MLSDIHYASDAEKARRDYFVACVTNRFRRFALHLYRHYYWQRDPFAHNYLLDDFIAQTDSANLVVALGDYMCDSGFLGLSDQAAFASAAECLGKLRAKFEGRFLCIIGDHELGKRPLGAAVGGMRLASMERAKELGIAPFWTKTVGNYVLMGVTSTLIAMEVFAPECLPEELPGWEKLRETHMADIRQAFQELKPEQRVILFCHDPTALPFLWREEAVRRKLGQIERTLIGHLHSNWFLFQSRVLSGMPMIPFLGHSVKRFSTALREARYWKPFNLLLCPSISGIELLKDGGYFTGELDPQAAKPARFQLHRLKRRPAEGVREKSSPGDLGEKEKLLKQFPDRCPAEPTQLKLGVNESGTMKKTVLHPPTVNESGTSKKTVLRAPTVNESGSSKKTALRPPAEE